MKILEKIDCPYKIIDWKVPKEERNQQYEQALAKAREKGEGYPVLVPVSDTLLESLELAYEEGYQREKWLQMSYEDGENMLNKMWQDFIDSIEEYEDEEFAETIIGEYGDGESDREQMWDEERIVDDEFEEFILFQIPVDEPWKIPIYIPFHAWNHDITPEQIVIAGKYWYQKYGAFPKLMDYDSIEYRVESPVTTVEEGWKLAKQQWGICADAGQIHESVGHLASCLKNSKTWYLWWD